MHGQCPEEILGAGKPLGSGAGDQGGLEAGKEQLPAVFTTGNSVDGEAVSEADRQVGRAREICKIALKMLRSYG